MKGIIFDIKRFAVHDGDGIRTTLFLKGCPLRCIWCHNPESISMKKELMYYEHKCKSCGECISACKSGAQDSECGSHIFKRSLCTGDFACAEVCKSEALKAVGREVLAEEILPRLLLDRAFYENSGGGVTLSGGECLLQADFSRELLMRLKAEGINTAVDTSGAVPWESIEKVLPYTDKFLYDIKAYDGDLHKRLTGRKNEQIIENLRRLDELGASIEIRVPFVPGLNQDEMPKIAALVKSLKTKPRVRVLAYHNSAGAKYRALGLANTLPAKLPTEEELKAARDLFGDLIKA